MNIIISDNNTDFRITCINKFISVYQLKSLIIDKLISININKLKNNDINIDNIFLTFNNIPLENNNPLIKYNIWENDILKIN